MERWSRLETLLTAQVPYYSFGDSKPTARWGGFRFYLYVGTLSKALVKSKCDALRLEIIDDRFRSRIFPSTLSAVTATPFSNERLSTITNTYLSFHR